METAISFDAPDVDLSSGVDDTELETGAEGAEGAEGTAEGEAEGDGQPAEPGKPFQAVENGKLNAAAKATIEKLKVENPQLAKAVQRALFAEDRLRKELPGGFKDLAQLREKIEQLGGDEGIQSMRGQLDGWKDFDAKYTAGDSTALEFMTETPEGQAGFLKIAPAAFEKFRQLSPDGFDAYTSQVFLADMRENELPMTIQLLGSVLSRATLTEADKTEASKLYTSLTGYVNRIGELSKKQAAAPATATKPGVDPRAAELDTREQALRKTEWGNETLAQHGKIFSEAWKRLAVNVPKEKVPLVRRLYGIHLQEKLGAKKDFDANMNRYFSAKQKDGFMRLHDSTFKEAVPLALRSAMAEAGIGARKAPAAPKPGEPTARPGAPAKPPAGFTPVAAKPPMGEVNNVLTSPEMWAKHQAVLKSGKRVSW